MAGSVQTVPVHAMVMMFACVISPHVTMTAGTGYTMVPGFHCILLIMVSFRLYADLLGTFTLNYSKCGIFYKEPIEVQVQMR